MFQLDNVLVSESIIEKQFACNLSACKGSCCIEGNAGAPLEKEETKILDKIYPKIKALLRKQGIDSIDKQGTWICSSQGELETPLIDGADCAYVIFNNKGIALCAIEQAYNRGIIDWKKPISCHLYPIRVKHYKEFCAVNYQKWDICHTACTLGKQKQTPVFKFVKQALIRKFGEQWYEKLEKIADIYVK
ncbi:MAG: DUF3109 family protein [Tenacibaculum sp.]